MAIGSLPVSVIGKKINGVFTRPDVVVINKCEYYFAYVLGVPLGWVLSDVFSLYDSSCLPAILALDE